MRPNYTCLPDYNIALLCGAANVGTHFISSFTVSDSIIRSYFFSNNQDSVDVEQISQGCLHIKPKIIFVFFVLLTEKVK